MAKNPASMLRANSWLPKLEFASADTSVAECGGMDEKGASWKMTDRIHRRSSGNMFSVASTKDRRSTHGDHALGGAVKTCGTT